MNTNGRKWWAPLATVLASLVLVTGVGVTPASADHITVSNGYRIVDPNWCYGATEYDRPVWLSGYFATARGQEMVQERYFYGCYRFYPNGEMRMPGGTWIFNGSRHFVDGYKHGVDIALNGIGLNRMPLYGTYMIDGVQTLIDGNYDVTSQGEIWYKNDFHRLGEWSDWYEAGVTNGYAATQRRLDACFARITLVDVEPRTYGPELTFEVKHYLPEVTAQRVVVGFREVSEGSRLPKIVSGEFPWCVDSWFRYTAEGPRLTLDLGNTYVLSYNNEGPYYLRYWRDIPGWTPEPTHNEDLWANRSRLPAMG